MCARFASALIANTWWLGLRIALSRYLKISYLIVFVVHYGTDIIHIGLLFSIDLGFGEQEALPITRWSRQRNLLFRLR
jgi:hypothetical protein